MTSKTNYIDEISSLSVQINNGLAETCSDGACLAFDKKYGIMFCAYMPGYHGDYGESRGKIHLSYFPASQPTNIKFVEIAEGCDVYVPNIISLGEGKVRVFYEKDSHADRDHTICYKDFDFKDGSLTDEQIVTVTKEDGSSAPLNLTECFSYLDKNGYYDHVYEKGEQIIFGGHTPFLADDGYYYGCLPSMLSPVILYRSKDNIASVEFFAIYPKPVQYEFDYKFSDGKIYAVYRTDQDKNGNSFAFSCDNGKTWSEPIDFENSIQCRPRIIISGGKAVLSYNYCDENSGNRPFVIMGRTAIKLSTIEDNKIKELCDLHSKYGIVNIALCDVLGDVYMAYSTSELALEYQNGTPWVRGKDAIRYIKLGDLFSK